MTRTAGLQGGGLPQKPTCDHGWGAEGTLHHSYIYIYIHIYIYMYIYIFVCNEPDLQPEHVQPSLRGKERTKSKPNS